MPLNLHDGDPERLQHLPDQRELLPELVRGLLPLGLVLRVLLEAHGRGPLVEGHGDPVGPLLREELDEHRGEAVDGVGHLAGGGGERGGEREEGPVGEAVSVQKEESLGPHARRL